MWEVAPKKTRQIWATRLGKMHMTLKVPHVGILKNPPTVTMWKSKARHEPQTFTNKNTQHPEHTLRRNTEIPNSYTNIFVLEARRSLHNFAGLDCAT